jgi:hypothetical protein
MRSPKGSRCILPPRSHRCKGLTPTFAKALRSESRGLSLTHFPSWHRAALLPIPRPPPHAQGAERPKQTATPQERCHEGWKSIEVDNAVFSRALDADLALELRDGADVTFHLIELRQR